MTGPSVVAPAPRPVAHRSLASLWVSLIAPPLIFLAQLEVSYLLVPWTCVHQDGWWLHVVTLVALVLVVAAGLNAWRLLRTISAEGAAGGESPAREPRFPPRGRFVAKLAILVSVLFFVALVAQGIPSFVLWPCQ